MSQSFRFYKIKKREKASLHRTHQAGFCVQFRRHLSFKTQGWKRASVSKKKETEKTDVGKSMMTQWISRQVLVTQPTRNRHEARGSSWVVSARGVWLGWPGWQGHTNVHMSMLMYMRVLLHIHVCTYMCSYMLIMGTR